MTGMFDHMADPYREAARRRQAEQMMERKSDPVVDAARRYLTGQHATLWGATFNVYDDMESAATWLAGEVRGVLRELDSVRWIDKLGA